MWNSIIDFSVWTFRLCSGNPRSRTCAIIRVWDYPNKPTLAKVVPIRIGTLLAKY